VHYLSDQLRIGIDPKMQLAPSPPRADAVFLIEPFGRRKSSGPSTVDQ
jgi:hypothetical protein